MPRGNRATQFAPFDALKGLQHALRVKEYEHDKKAKGDLSEEIIAKISNSLLNLKKGQVVKVKYYNDGYYETMIGSANLLIEKAILKVSDVEILLDNICDMDFIND